MSFLDGEKRGLLHNEHLLCNRANDENDQLTSLWRNDDTDWRLMAALVVMEKAPR